VDAFYSVIDVFDEMVQDAIARLNKSCTTPISAAVTGKVDVRGQKA